MGRRNYIFGAVVLLASQMSASAFADSLCGYTANPKGSAAAYSLFWVDKGADGSVSCTSCQSTNTFTCSGPLTLSPSVTSSPKIASSGCSAIPACAKTSALFGSLALAKNLNPNPSAKAGSKPGAQDQKPAVTANLTTNTPSPQVSSKAPSLSDVIAQSDGKTLTSDHGWVTVKKITVDGKKVTAIQNDDGSYSSATDLTTKLTPDKVSSDGTQYVTGDKTYANRAAWISARDSNGGNGTITYADGSKVTYVDGKPTTHVDKDGNVVARTSKDAKKSDKTDTNCEKSQEIDPNFACDGTYTLAKITDVGNTVLTGAGRQVVNQIGSIAQQNAQTGKQSDVYQGSATMAKTSFTYESILTAANLAAATKLSQKAAEHSKNIAALKQGADYQKVDANYEGNKGLDYTGARVEQAAAKKEAQEGAYKAAITGVTSLANAMVAKQTQTAMQKAANTQRAIEAKLNNTGVAFDGTSALTGVAGLTNTSAATADTSGTDGSSGITATSPDPSVSGTPTLGAGSDLGGGDDSGPNAPTAGKFKAADNSPGGAGGGAGGGAAGAGAAGAPPTAAEEAKAQYATEFGSKERYEGAGTPGAAAKAGAAKGGKEDGAGIDLNGILAQFLPKDEKDMGPKNGILDYGGFGGGRSPASADEAPSYLDKKADLFKRVSETMEEKFKKGMVGI